MPTAIPSDLSANTMLVASLILAFLLLVAFFRKSLLADRLAAAAERRAESGAKRVAELEAKLQRHEPAADRDDLVQILHELPRALRVPEEARTRRQMGEALGAGLERVLEPEQWMVFLDVEGDGKQYALVAAGAQSGGTWPVGACLTPQMGRVGLVVRRKKAMDRADFLAEPPIVRDQIAETEPSAFRVDLAAPIVVRDRVVGAIAVGGSRVPTCVAHAVVELFADHAALLHRLATAQQRAVRLENRDEVTGLHNRSWFTAHGAELLFRHREQLVPMVCAIVGIDDYSIYAAREGPTKAHRLLQQVATVLQPMFRKGDLLCRWTEEEFAALLPNMDRGSAGELLDRLRRRVAAEPFEGAENQPEGAVTISVGVAAVPEDGRSLDALIDHAYRAFRVMRGGGVERPTGEVDLEDEFLDVGSGLADAPSMKAMGGFDTGDL